VAVDSAAVVAGAISGAAVSAIVGPWIAGRHSRRDLRATVLRSIAEVERTRWSSDDYGPFRNAIVSCRAAALVAGLNREPTDRYLLYAQICREANETDAEMNPDRDPGGIPLDLLNLTRASADTLVNQLWHPYRSRLLARRDRRRILAFEAEVKTDHEDDHPAIALRWDQRLG